MERFLLEGLGKMHIEPPTTVAADTLFGFAFLESWNTEITLDSSYDQALLMVLKDGNRRRRGAINLQHRVKLALQLMHPITIDSAAATADSLLRLWQQCLSVCMRVSVPGISSSIPFDAGRDRTIGDAIKEHGTVVHLWPMPHLVAVAICAGVCSSDFSAVCQREKCPWTWRPPHLPSDLKSIGLPKETAWSIPSKEFALRVVSDRQRAKGFQEEFTIDAKIADTEVTWDLKSIKHVNMDAHVAKVDRLQQCLGKILTEQCGGRKNMGGTTRLANFSRLDICGMLAHRERYAEDGPFFRFLATDKGPQKKESWELLNTVEVAIPRSEVVGKALMDINASSLRRRKLAPCCMAQSRTDLPNTVWSLQHQCWLDYGPTAAQLSASNADVIGVGTDLGTEAAICDHHDVTDLFIDSIHAGPDDENTCPSEDPSELLLKSFLFPVALKIAGPLHCIDWIIRAAFNKIPGFVEYMTTGKSILQYMHSKAHRVFMQRKLKSLVGLPAEVLRQCLEDLDNGCGRFADWRWRSIQQCTKDLARFHLSISSICGGDLKDFRLSRNTKAAAALKNVTGSPLFWQMNKLLALLLGPLMKLHGWVQGCPCHPIDSPDDSRPLNCPFAGLNCRGFSGKLAETIASYEIMRSNRSLDEFGEAVAVTEMMDVIGFIIGMLVLKLQRWVDDLPYLIWQVTVHFLYNFIHNFNILASPSPQVTDIHVV